VCEGEVAVCYFQYIQFVFCCVIVTTVLANSAPVWVTGRGAGQPFVVRAIINYPVQYGIMYPLISLLITIYVFVI